MTLSSPAQAAGAQLLSSVTVEKLHLVGGRVCGVVCEGEPITASYVVLAEGANSLLAEQHQLISRPSPHAMALGIKEVMALDRGLIEERFHLEGNQGVAWLFSGGVCGNKPGGAFLYTNQETLSFGVVCPLASLGNQTTAAAGLLANLKRHPALRPLLRHAESVEYGAHLVPEGGVNAMPVQKGGDGWLLIGDALGACVNTGFTIRGMDLAILSAQAAAQTLISACQNTTKASLFSDYHQQLERSTLWAVLRRYQAHPSLLQRTGWYQRWPDLCRDLSHALWNVQSSPTPPLWQLLWHNARKHGMRHLAADILRSLRCL